MLMSNLVSHAKRELEICGEDPETVEAILKMIDVFASMGHSGESAFATIEILTRLLRYENLSPLTTDPEEWMVISEEVWGAPGGICQSRRNAEAFSKDGGKTYYLLSEGGNDQNPEPLHESVPHKEVVG